MCIRIQALLLLTGLTIAAHAEEVALLAPPPVKARSFFARGNWEGMAGGAVMFSPLGAVGGRPEVNYAMAVGQAGYMLTEVRGPGLLRGNFEAVGEVFGGSIYQGRGSYVTGLTLWGRYNFVPQDWRVTPYAQLGLGIGMADKDKNVFGSLFGFNIDAALGARYFVRPQLALHAEYRFQHISNANTAPHNLGINAHGPMVGVAWLF